MRKSSKKLPGFVLVIGRSRKRLDGVGERNRTPRDLGVEKLDHAPVMLDGAFALVLGQLEGVDDLASRCDLLGRRREDGIARLDLCGMDQRLAVEAEALCLAAGDGET